MRDEDRRAQRPVSAKKHAVRMAGISVIAGIRMEDRMKITMEKACFPMIATLLWQFLHSSEYGLLAHETHPSLL